MPTLQKSAGTVLVRPGRRNGARTDRGCAHRYGAGSHPLLARYAKARAALTGEAAALARVAPGLGPRARVVAARLASERALGELRRGARAALEAVAAAPGGRGVPEGGAAARGEAARAALDLLLRHRAAHERPLRKVLKGLDRDLATKVDGVAEDLAQAASDSLAAALEALQAWAPPPAADDGDLASLPGALTLAEDACALLRRLLAPPIRAAFSLLRARGAGRPPPWARDAAGRRAATAAAMGHGDALVPLRALSGDFGYPPPRRSLASRSLGLASAEYPKSWPRRRRDPSRNDLRGIIHVPAAAAPQPASKE